MLQKRCIKECLLNLKISDPEEIRKILKELENLIISIRNNYIDDSSLIKALPIIAQELKDSELFIKALKIEALFFKLLSNSVVYYEWRGTCTDYGYDMGGTIEVRAISKSLFFIYRGLFKERTKLTDFVNSFLQVAEQKKESIDTEAKLVEYLSNIAGQIVTLKKCIALDADGVLWDGIIGEDGIDGIKITSMHIEFQKRLKIKTLIPKYSPASKKIPSPLVL